jgi:hypothetical protein
MDATVSAVGREPWNHKLVGHDRKLPGQELSHKKLT